MGLFDIAIDDMGCRSGAPNVGVGDNWLEWFGADEVGGDAPTSTSGEAD